MSRSTCWLRVHGFPSSSRCDLGLVPVVGTQRRCPTTPNSAEHDRRTPGRCRTSRRATQPNSANSSGVSDELDRLAERVRRTLATSPDGRGAPPAKPSRPAPGSEASPRLRAEPACESIRNLWSRFLTGQTGARIFTQNPAKLLDAGPARGQARWRRRSSRSTTSSRGGRAGGVRGPLRAAPGATRTPGWNHANSSSARPGDHERHERVALLRVGRARARRADSSAVHAQRITTVRRGPWPRRMRRWWRWPASAWCQCWRLHEPAHEREHDVEDRHAEDDAPGSASGREEEVRVAREREVGAAADRDRRHREQHAEEQRARVAHDDLRRDAS